MNYDIIIVGCGTVGLTAALLLAKNPTLNIAILEASAISPAWNKDKIDHRVSAISLASQNIFQQLQVWPTILKKRASPYHKMHVWDENSNGEIHFDCREVDEPQLGFIIEDNVVRASLLEKIQEHANITLFFSQKLIALQETEDEIILTTNQDQTFKTKLLIGADGANSVVRDLAKIAMDVQDYGHTAIVTQVETELSHQQTAWQRFLTTGPLAFLPLQDKNTCSIVWSTLPNDAHALLQQDEQIFCETLGQAFAHRLGKIKSISARYHFPLRMRHVKNYVKHRIALIGDAAHTLHPLAGQGVNLGLQDALVLSEVILQAIEKNRDFASFATLRKYERARKSNNLLMLHFVGMIKKVFGSENRMVQTLRDKGLNGLNDVSLIKKFFVNYALGKPLSPFMWMLDNSLTLI